MDGLRVERLSTGVAVVVLDRPERLNSLDHRLFVALGQVFVDLAQDETVRVVVLTGAGRGFCAGADILGDPPPSDEEGATQWMREVQQAPLALFHLPQPCIAVVNGPASGGGVGLALACDIRIAAPSASFSVPFVRMGLGPDFGTSRTLPQVIGRSAAMQTLLTGHSVTAEEALALGLVSQVSGTALEEGVTLAERIAAMPAEATRRIKALLRESATAEIDTVVGDIEPRYQAQGICDPRFAERRLAWMDTKKAVAAEGGNQLGSDARGPAG